MKISSPSPAARRFFGGLLLLALSVPQLSAEAVRWTKDYNDALKRARSENKPVLISFTGSDWCSWCRRLESEIFSKEKFGDYANKHFICVQLDTTYRMMQSRQIPHEALIQKFKVQGYPTVVILNSAAKEVGRTGYMEGGPEPFITYLSAFASVEEKPKEEPASKEKLRIDRRPEALLKLAQQLVGGEADPSELNTAAALRRWEGVREALGKMPEADGIKAYAQLLTDLAAMPQALGVCLLYSEDILALADLSPQPLKDSQLQRLGQMLKTSLRQGGAKDALIEQLKAGTRTLGGFKADTRRRAARLLFAADLVAEGAEFLDTPDEALDSRDTASLEFHIKNLMARGLQRGDAEALKKAWDLNLSRLEGEALNAENPALGILYRLLPHLQDADRKAWLMACKQDTPQMLVTLTEHIGGQVLSQLKSGDLAQRGKNLQLMAELAELTLDWEALPAEGRAATLSALASAWLGEARISIKSTQQQNDTARAQRMGSRSSRRSPPSPYLPATVLLDTVPGAAWTDLLAYDQVDQISLINTELCIVNHRWFDACDLLSQLVSNRPTDAHDLTTKLFREWATENDLRQIHGLGNQASRSRQAVPLTTAMQRRSVDELSRLTDWLFSIPQLKIDNNSLVKAFVNCHPPSEVYRKASIEAVFGDPASMNRSLLAPLVTGMRENLTKTWRDLEVQVKGMTGRNKTQVHQEVQRGYQLLHDLLAENLTDKPEDWRMALFLGAVLYDWAEYDYAEGIPLETYVERREIAFMRVEEGALMYNQLVPDLTPENYDLTAYQLWFQIILGASDLAHVKGHGDPAGKRLETLRKGILGLEPEAAKLHLENFAKNQLNSLGAASPQSKDRLLRAALVVIGEDLDGAKPLLERVAFYDELTGKHGDVRLVMRVDGHPEVGHGQPFGAILQLEHSKALAASTGGFGRYLQNAPSQNYYGSSQQTRANHRDLIEEGLVESLSEFFDLVSITFQDSSQPPLPHPTRDDWEVTPVAYIQLKPRDAAVDRIPPVSVNLDFRDQSGVVVLPVQSAVIPVDARAAEVPSRPLKNITLVQTLDTRMSDEGRIELEIRAEAHGLLPRLEELVDLSQFPVLCESTEDQGQLVKQLITEEGLLWPASERTWTLILTPKDGKQFPSRFVFPHPRGDDKACTYYRYQDADLEELDGEAALAGVPMSPWGISGWLVAALLLLIIMGVVAYRLTRPRAANEEHAAHYLLPHPATPFSVLSLLKRLREDSMLPSIQAERATLDQDIQDIEQHYFAPDVSPPSDPNELTACAKRWLAKI